MQDIYNNQVYLKQNQTWHEEDAPFKAEKILALLLKNNYNPQTVFEAGCGSAAILTELEKKMPAVQLFEGYDISVDAYAIAKKKETEKIKIFHEDFTKKELSEKADLLLVIDVLEHIENYFSFLRAVVTKSNYTVFHIPLDVSVWSLFREAMLIESKQRVGHIHNFTEDFIISILQDIGFIVIDKVYTPPIHENKTVKQKFINSIRNFLFFLNKRFGSKLIGGYSILLFCKNK